MHNSSASYKCTCTFTCREAEFKREAGSETKADPLSLSFSAFPSLSGVSAGSYNPSLEKCGPVKQHKRIGAQIPLD